MIEQDQFKKIGEDIAAIHRFITKEEMTPPVCQIEEAETAKAECWQAVHQVGGYLIDFLKDKRVAEFVFHGPYHNEQVSIYSGRFTDKDSEYYGKYNRIAIDLVREQKENERINICLTEQEDYRYMRPSFYSGGKNGGMRTANYEEEVQKELEKYQAKLRNWYHSAKSDWEWYKKDGKTHSRNIGGVGNEITRYYSFEAKKILEASDLADNLWLFEGFVFGSGELFQIAHQRINALSLTEQEVERLRRITAVCFDACQLIEEATKN